LGVENRSTAHLQRGEKAADADGKSYSRSLLASEARDEIVVAPSPADRTEHDVLTLLVLYRKCQLCLEHRARVVVETTDDRRIDEHFVHGIAGIGDKIIYRREFGNCGFANAVAFHSCLEVGESNGVAGLAAHRTSATVFPSSEVQQPIHGNIRQARTLCEIAALIFSALAKKSGHTIE